jgi:hypothetical protein
MSKVSIGLRGWRFDEDVVFDEDGGVGNVAEMPEDTRNRLLRLSALLGEPCSACWLVHGEERVEQCNTGEVVYGEPLAEVLLCTEHESDFVYWFQEAGGSAHAGSETLQDEFFEWFADGNRAPEAFGSVEHVDEAPDDLPDPMAADSLDEVAEQAATLNQEEEEALDLDLDGLDV